MTARSVEKLSRARLSNQAADAIKRLIVMGVYRPHARLPTEKELAEELGVTRLTVREALSQLSAAGFVVTRHGSGSYVRDVGEGNLALFAEMLSAGRQLTAEESVSLMEFRAIVIGGFAEAIAQRREPAHVSAMRAILADARRTTDPAALAVLDYGLNDVLARASGNLFLALLMRSVREVHVELGALVYRARDRDTILATLDALADAIESGPPARVKKVLAKYLEGGTEVIRARLRTGRRRKT